MTPPLSPPLRGVGEPQDRAARWGAIADCGGRKNIWSVRFNMSDAAPPPSQGGGWEWGLCKAVCRTLIQHRDTETQRIFFFNTNFHEFFMNYYH